MSNNNRIIGAEGYKELDSVRERVVAKITSGFEANDKLLSEKQVFIDVSVFLIDTKTGEEKLSKGINNIPISALNIDQEILKICKFYTIQSMHERGYKTFVFEKGQLALEKDKE